MKNKKEQTRKNIKNKFPWRSFFIILSIFLFFPLGLILMWKFATWTKKTKWIVTVATVFLLVFGLITNYYSEPEIVVNDSNNGRINTDNSSYIITGYLSSMRGDTTLTINDKLISLNAKLEFRHQLSLVEGDNRVKFSATNDNGTTNEDFILYRTTSAELEARRVKQKAEEAASASQEAEKKAKETEQPIEEKKVQDYVRPTETKKPYEQFSSFIPRGSSSANIQNWAYTGGGRPTEAQAKEYMKDIFNNECGKGTSWGRCDILLWDKKYDVNSSVYNDTCVDQGGYREQLLAYIKGTSEYGQFFYYCKSGNVTLSEDSRGMVITNSVDGKPKYTTSYYVDSGYVDEAGY